MAAFSAAMAGFWRIWWKTRDWSNSTHCPTIRSTRTDSTSTPFLKKNAARSADAAVHRPPDAVLVLQAQQLAFEGADEQRLEHHACRQAGRQRLQVARAGGPPEVQRCQSKQTLSCSIFTLAAPNRRLVCWPAFCAGPVRPCRGGDAWPGQLCWNHVAARLRVSPCGP